MCRHPVLTHLPRMESSAGGAAAGVLISSIKTLRKQRSVIEPATSMNENGLWVHLLQPLNLTAVSKKKMGLVFWIYFRISLIVFRASWVEIKDGGRSPFWRLYYPLFWESFRLSIWRQVLRALLIVFPWTESRDSQSWREAVRVFPRPPSPPCGYD